MHVCCTFYIRSRSEFRRSGNQYDTPVSRRPKGSPDPSLVPTREKINPANRSVLNGALTIAPHADRSSHPRRKSRVLFPSGANFIRNLNSWAFSYPVFLSFRFRNDKTSAILQFPLSSIKIIINPVTRLRILTGYPFKNPLLIPVLVSKRRPLICQSLQDWFYP